MDTGRLREIAGLLVISAVIVFSVVEKFERCKSGEQADCCWGSGNLR